MAMDLSPRNNDAMYPIICYAKDAKAVASMGGKNASKVAEYYDIQ